GATTAPHILGRDASRERPEKSAAISSNHKIPAMTQANTAPTTRRRLLPGKLLAHSPATAPMAAPPTASVDNKPLPRVGVGTEALSKSSLIAVTLRASQFGRQLVT
ncbi:MAG TPA: hypothetical protein VL068_11110, partial [Microthrixaceae bacterium]|nr:hypothetical protein [Microthrixaceae bacterium]